MACIQSYKNEVIISREKLNQIIDKNSFNELDANMISKNYLHFEGYDEKLKRAEIESNEREAVISGFAKIIGISCVIFIFEPLFMMGTMGYAVGQKITHAFDIATKKKLPVISISASGGARMQEGIFSLVQMANTAGAVYRHSRKGLFYVSIISDPTFGGVAASFASLGDIIIAEENSRFGFAGKSIIQETTHEKFSDQFQTANFAKNHGMVDMIAKEDELSQILSKLLLLHSRR